MRQIASRPTRKIRPFPGLLIFAAASTTFVFIAGVVKGKPPSILDTNVASWLHAHSAPFLTEAMIILSFLGAPSILSGVAVLIGLLLALQRRFDRSVLLLIVVLGGNLLNYCLKLLIQRGRPTFEDPLFMLPTYSFPSGHAMAATVFYGGAALYLAARAPSRFPVGAALAAAILMIALVCFSRLYLGVHYLTDVIGGLTEGIAWLALSLTAFYYFHRGPTSVPGRK